MWSLLGGVLVVVVAGVVVVWSMGATVLSFVDWCF